MNSKIKIVATAVIAASFLTSCGNDIPPNAGMPAFPQMTPPTGGPPPIESKQSDSDEFVSVDPISSENSDEETTE